MDNTDVKKETLGDMNLYSNQAKYNSYVVKKLLVYRFAFLISAIASLVTMFVIPMYKYELLGKKRGQMRIIGNYTPEYIIEKYFNMTLGPHSLLNTCLVISIVFMMILSLYLVIGAVINLFAKKQIEAKGFISKIFSYGILEVVAVVLFILLLLSMVFCKVDVTGNAENIIGFWIVFAASIVMTCTSISLSSK